MTKARAALPSPLRSPTAKLLVTAPVVLRVVGPLNPLTTMVDGRVMVETGLKEPFAVPSWTVKTARRLLKASIMGVMRSGWPSPLTSPRVGPGEDPGMVGGAGKGAW